MKTAVKEKTELPIAVSLSEHKEFGCPHCGYRSGSKLLEYNGSASWKCGECGKYSCILADGRKKSGIGFGNYYPELQDHPRRGTPSHGRRDKKPEGGGEFFHPRGIGLDDCVCFVCGTHDRDGKGNTMLHNIAAFVECKASGERIVSMFKKRARLDYREYEPDRVQVKVGACDTHLSNLKKLGELTGEGIIKVEYIAKAKI